MKPLRGILTGLALATAATTGTLALNTLSTPPDTAWGSDHIQDTAWGTPPTVDGTVDIVITPLDTAWG
ncbi:hypothetical protein [Streptomyces collinus]|uniref:hypothetical protein n=1 Tax=Streptomyces collinus TaxID=42684 RepID=UPI0037FCC96F